MIRFERQSQASEIDIFRLNSLACTGGVMPKILDKNQYHEIFFAGDQ